MPLDTTYFQRCIDTLSKAHGMLLLENPENIAFDMYRSACVKEFEIILEQSGKLLKKILKPYFHSNKEVDKLHFKDIFRQATLRSLIDEQMCERWMQYRDNRNNTAHDYGVNFAEETLNLIPQFILDAQFLANLINTQTHDIERER